ncbi:MAG: hypothetical protein WCZ89_02100 [Phycisphaerae bacterium]
MSLSWVGPEKFLLYHGVSIFHTYKDEFSDIPLEFWYSTSSTAEPGSPYEFDVRDLADYKLLYGTDEMSKHKKAIKNAIDAGLLKSETSVMLNKNA